MSSLSDALEEARSRKAAAREVLRDRAPERFKSGNEMSVDEHLKYIRTNERPERSEYRQYVRDVHELAGLDVPEEHDDDVEVEDQDVEHHLRQITGKRRR